MLSYAKFQAVIEVFRQCLKFPPAMEKSGLKAFYMVIKDEFTDDEFGEISITYMKMKSNFPAPADLIKMKSESIVLPDNDKIWYELTRIEYMSPDEIKSSPYYQFFIELFKFDSRLRMPRGKDKDGISKRSEIDFDVLCEANKWFAKEFSRGTSSIINMRKLIKSFKDIERFEIDNPKIEDSNAGRING